MELAWLRTSYHASGKRKYHTHTFPFIQFLICSSRKNIITTASTSTKLDWLLQLPNGPTHAVNYKTQDFVAETKKITDGKGVDVIIDFPGQSHFVKNIDALAVDGRMTMLALLSGQCFFFRILH